MEHFIFDDGGRAAAGFHGYTGDCVTRAIAIAACLSYQKVYDELNELAGEFRSRGKNCGTRSTSPARTGVPRKLYDLYLKNLGWTLTPTMMIGQGCRVHLRHYELPGGRLILRVSKHMVAMIDGVIHDTFDCSRGGTRCVYGYYTARENAVPTCVYML